MSMLYQDFRPSTFADMVGQDVISETLRNQVRKNTIAHAYLFYGSRGTGKTSASRILSKAVNCLHPVNGEPCGKCEMCKRAEKGTNVDIIELDAASNNSVENIRRIIDNVKYPPTMSKYKVYIIDECHMLSTGAVNAFLKTLEEPPENVIFILATTDPQKLPVTIKSRCQQFEFRRIQPIIIFKRLKEISIQRNVQIDDQSLSLISKVADGAMRDALSIYERVITSDDGSGIKYNKVLNMLGVAVSDQLFQLSEAVIDKNHAEALNTLNDIDKDGKDYNIFIKDCINHFRNILMAKETADPSEIIAASVEDIKKMKIQSDKISEKELIRYIEVLQEAENNVKWSNNARTSLELAIIKMCSNDSNTALKNLMGIITELQNEVKNLQLPQEKLSQRNQTTNENHESIDAEDTYSNSVNTKDKQFRNKFEDAKMNIIKTLNDTPKFKNLAIALTNSKIYLKQGNIMMIDSNNDQDTKNILHWGQKVIRMGFATNLNINFNIIVR